MNPYELTTDTLYEPGDCIELRGGTKKHDVSVGIDTFDNLPRATEVLDRIEGEDAIDLHLCLNPNSIPSPAGRTRSGNWKHDVKMPSLFPA